MTRGSLRLRLVLLAVLSTVFAVAAAGAALVVLAERHVQRRLVQEVVAHLDQLTAHFRLVDEGTPGVPDDLADPRFTRPFSGLYWQVTQGADPKVRSRSLWDQVLTLPPEGGGTGPYELDGPRDQVLLAMERRVSLAARPGGPLTEYRLVVAEDQAEIDSLVREFALEAASFLFALVAFLTLAGWATISVGLKPLDSLRDLVLDIRRGKARRLAGDFPDEVEPLVAELNGLIDAQEQALERARGRAGDLAHGLKTPLAVLATESRSLRSRGEEASAEAIDAEIAGMSRFVERELARSRAAALPYLQRLDLSRALDRLIGAMQRLPRGEELEWLVDIPTGLMASVHAEDANEIFGNLLDNARKWAATRIEVRAEAGPDRIRVVVADDGPGVPVERREAVLLRGIRLDETVQGSGLGLSIVDDLVVSYAGSLVLGETAGGGLTVEVSLPGGDGADERPG